MNTNFSNLLKCSGMTIYKLSKRSGVPYTVVHEIASGKKDINHRPVETVARLAATLGVELQELLEPIYYMDKVSGKYRGVSYTWSHDHKMELSVRAGTFSEKLEVPYQMTNPRDKRAYDAFTEICIDQALKKQEAEQRFALYLEQINHAGYTSEGDGE